MAAIQKLTQTGDPDMVRLLQAAALVGVVIERAAIRWCSAAHLRTLMTKLSGTDRHLDSGFRRNDGKSRHPGESRDPQRPISTGQRAALH